MEYGKLIIVIITKILQLFVNLILVKLKKSSGHNAGLIDIGDIILSLIMVLPIIMAMNGFILIELI